ncbi:MAG: LacI family DNA-binding transcriptional regulator [Nakamurella sp.]
MSSSDRQGSSGPITLQDVAREAQVAVSTVSRALSNPDRVSRATREHVAAVARKLGYQAQRQGPRTQLLAMLVPDITNPFNFDLIRGAQAQARAVGYSVVVGDSQQDPDLEVVHAERLRTSVEGLILGASRLPEQILRQIAEAAPVVLFNRQLAGVASVVLDAVDGSRQIVDHLAALGHRSIAYLAGPREAWTDDERWRALSAAAGASGVELVRLGPFLPTLEQGRVAADVGLASGASALIAFNDLLAIGALQRLEGRGIPVPGEISVVGYDDIFGADFCHPPLTTLASPIDQVGRIATDMLLTRLLGLPLGRERERVAAHLTIRDSTGTARK